MDAVAYIRVSSRAQGLEMQRDAIERGAAARGDTIVAWYSEKASAKTTARLELQHLRADVRAGAVRKAYVFKLDRLVRTGVADTFAVVDEMRRAGVTLVALADNLMIQPDSTDVTSEVLVFALGLAAKLERTAINDRISAARDRMAAAGRSWGRPRRMDRGMIQRARQMRQDGRSVRWISAALKTPRSTVDRALRASVSRKAGP